MTQKGIWNVARKKMFADRGALPKEDGYQLREYEAMHEEKLCNCWLRDDVKEGKVEVQGWRKEAREDDNKNGKREVEREDEKTVIKKRCVKLFSRYVLRNSVPWMSRKVLWILVATLAMTLAVVRCVCLRCRRVSVVTDVSVSPSMVSVTGEDF